MGLQLIIGGSGTGKTRLMYEKLLEKSESVDYKDSRFFVIVPEQFTMETQKTIVDLSANKGTMNIDIISFKRLAKRLFDEAGVNIYTVLDDTGKCLILRKIIEENKQNLSVFANKTKMTNFIDEMKSMISEFYQYGINDDKFEEIFKKVTNKPLLSAKLKDIKIVADKFKEYINDKFIVSEELLTKACELIPKSEIIKNSHITLDEYTGFSPVQYEVIRGLLKYSESVTITATIRDTEGIDYLKESETDIFNISKKTINRIKNIAKEEGVEVYSDIILNDLLRLKNSAELSYLENNIFKYGVKPYSKENVEDISIHICDNVLKEAEFVAYKICTLIRENGYRYKDIAVITADIGSYNYSITNIFNKYKIPCFIDDNRSVNTNPMVETIRALFEIVENNYSYESVFSYLRAGMSSLLRNEIDMLENYVISHGIRGFKKWNKNIEDENEIYENARIKLINDTKDFYDLYKKNKQAKVGDSITGLREIILKLDIKGKMEAIAKAFYNNGDISRGNEYRQTYEVVMELFLKMENLIGDEEVSPKELSAMLDSGFSEIKVGLVPPTLDRVVVGDIERTRLNNVKVLFLIGANDGMIPKSDAKTGVLTRSEREFLKESGIELSPTVRENSFIQKFYLYLLLTKMSEKLFISFYRTGSDMKSARPSYLVNSIVHMFRGINVIDESKTDNKIVPENITNKDIAISYISENIYDYISGKIYDSQIDLFKEIYVKCLELGIDMQPLINAAIYKAEESQLDRAVANVMYGKEMKNSISRLETFAACAYRHFVSYGLNLMERKEYVIQQNDIGNIYHKSIELYFTKVRDRKIAYNKIDDELRTLLINESVNEAAELEGTKVFSDSGRNEYMLDKIKRTANKTVWILGEQIIKGKFNPSLFEWRFSDKSGIDSVNFEFEDGRKMGLRGVIDRIDFYNNGDDIYVKIIDYKSGSRKFEINDVYEGLQLQLVMYMEAVTNYLKNKNPDKNIIPAGLFYYNIDDPIIKAEDIKLTDDTEKNKEILASTILGRQKPDGIFSDNENVLLALDKDIDELSKTSGKSLVIPAGFKKSGEFLKSSGNVTDLSMKCLLDYVHDKVKELGSEMINGKIEVNPYVKSGSNSSACTYCPYKNVCGFDKGIKGFKARELTKFDNESVWNEIRKKTLDEENN